MFNKSILWLFLGFIALLSAGCSTKKAQQTNSKFKKKSVTDLLAKAEENHINYTTFGAKAKVTIVEGTDTRSADARIRMVRDTAIWFSISLFGIEGARALLTPDSIKVLNRLDGTYISEGYNYFQKKYNIPLTFYSLQDMIVGNLPDRNPIGFSAATDSLGYTLSKGMDASTLSYLFDGTTLLTQKVSVEELREQRFFRLAFANYEPLEDKPTQQIATTRAISTRTAQGDFHLALDMSKIKLNQMLKMEFEIPEGYKRTRM
jgi:Domain of unknown function (DUF4292)